MFAAMPTPVRLAVHVQGERINFEGRGSLVGVIEAPGSSRVRHVRGRTILDASDCNDMEAPFALANAVIGNADLRFHPAPGVNKAWIRALADRA